MLNRNYEVGQLKYTRKRELGWLLRAKLEEEY